MRLKYLRDGVDDYDYVELLKQAGLGTWALSVCQTVGPDWSNWTRDASALEAAWVQLGSKLDSLNGGGESISVTASATPTTLASAGTTTLAASATDSASKSITGWSWSDGGAGGTFRPSATAENPTYTAPANTNGTNATIALTVTASSATASGRGAVSLQVQPQTAGNNTITVHAAAAPTTLASGAATTLSMSATDSLGHTGLAYQWSDNGAGGTFSPSATAEDPTYTAPVNKTGVPLSISLTASAVDEWQYPWVTGTAKCGVDGDLGGQ